MADQEQVSLPTSMRRAALPNQRDRFSARSSQTACIGTILQIEIGDHVRGGLDELFANDKEPTPQSIRGAAPPGDGPFSGPRTVTGFENPAIERSR